MLAPTIINACPFRDELNIFKSFSFKNSALQVVCTIDKALSIFENSEQLTPMLKMLAKVLATSGILPETYPKLNQSLINCLE